MPEANEYSYLQGQRRKTVLKSYAKLRRAEAQEEREGRPPSDYIWLDSRLYGTGQGAFNNFFKNALPEKKKDLGKYVAGTVGERPPGEESIGLELGGQGKNLFKDFEKASPGIFSRSISLTLAEHPVPESAAPEEVPLDHTILEGDMLDPAALDRLEAALGGKKVQFIVLRIAAGWDSIATQEPYHIVQALQRVYGMLALGGVMFLEVPREFKRFMEEWELSVAPSVNAGKLEAQYALRGDEEYRSAALRIRKFADEPLPMPDPRTIKSIIVGDSD